MPARATRCAGRPAISTPASLMLPALGLSSPERRLISVVLPAPLGPITACTSPGASARSTWLTAARPPKKRQRPVATRSGSAIGCILGSRFRREQAADAFRQQQDGEDDEEAHRQQPV